MSFSLTSPYNRLFTNKFLHVNINNKIILINRKEAYASPNSPTKITNKINNKIRLTHQKSLHTFVDAIPKRYMNKYVSLPP
jgi:hypothetical protein